MKNDFPDLARAKEIAHAIGISVATLWRWVQAGNFPAPYELSARHKAWRWSDVRAFLESKRARLRDDIKALDNTIVAMPS